MVKKILSILAWVATAAALVALFIAAREHYLNTPVKSVNIDIDRGTDGGFVKESTVLSDLGGISEGAKIGTINMDAIDKRLKANPWIESATAFVGLDGILNINIKEYDPVFRVFDRNGRSVYVSSEGKLLPPANGHTPHLLIASGHFDIHPEAAHQLSDTVEADRNVIGAMKVHEAIKRNEFMRNCVGQVYCNSRNEFEIVARGIDASIVLGDTCNLDDKLARLEIFIKQQAGRQVARQMKQINLKYKNQIVCTKR